jgi:hypothetical protein
MAGVIVFDTAEPPPFGEAAVAIKLVTGTNGPATPPPSGKTTPDCGRFLIWGPTLPVILDGDMFLAGFCVISGFGSVEVRWGVTVDELVTGVVSWDVPAYPSKFIRVSAAAQSEIDKESSMGVDAAQYVRFSTQETGYATPIRP